MLASRCIHRHPVPRCVLLWLQNLILCFRSVMRLSAGPKLLVCESVSEHKGPYARCRPYARCQAGSTPHSLGDGRNLARTMERRRPEKCRGLTPLARIERAAPSSGGIQWSRLVRVLDHRVRWRIQRIPKSGRCDSAWAAAGAGDGGAQKVRRQCESQCEAWRRPRSCRAARARRLI